MMRLQQMPSDAKEVLHKSMHGQESLRLSRNYNRIVYAKNGIAARKAYDEGCVPRSVEKERHPPLRHQGIRSGGNLRVFENLAQTLVAVDAP